MSVTPHLIKSHTFRNYTKKKAKCTYMIKIGKNIVKQKSRLRDLECIFVTEGYIVIGHKDRFTWHNTKAIHNLS
jgi:hypothetical protein